jgi:ABC-type antimicrobial peptide transport system permease subunit
VRTTLTRIDDAIPLSAVETMRERLDDSVARWRFAMTLLSLFAGVALVLALIGTWGVVSYTVGQRLPEIGVRMALGAGPARVVRHVLGGGLRLVGLGLALGLPATLVLSRGLTSLLYGVEPHDPLIYGGLALLLCTATLIATWLPARRASRVDPLTVLRCD